jgi:hypothetical protein
MVTKSVALGAVPDTGARAGTTSFDDAYPELYRSAYRVAFRLLGAREEAADVAPCWRVKSGSATVDCSEKMPAIVVGPNQTVDLVGTIWARKGLAQTGAPLAAGKYKIDLGDLQGTAYSFSSMYPYLTVS